MDSRQNNTQQQASLKQIANEILVIDPTRIEVKSREYYAFYHTFLTLFSRANREEVITKDLAYRVPEKAKKLMQAVNMSAPHAIKLTHQLSFIPDKKYFKLTANQQSARLQVHNGYYEYFLTEICQIDLANLNQSKHAMLFEKLSWTLSKYGLKPKTPYEVIDDQHLYTVLLNADVQCVFNEAQTYTVKFVNNNTNYILKKSSSGQYRLENLSAYQLSLENATYKDRELLRVMLEYAQQIEKNVLDQGLHLLSDELRANLPEDVQADANYIKIPSTIYFKNNQLTNTFTLYTQYEQLGEGSYGVVTTAKAYEFLADNTLLSKQKKHQQVLKIFNATAKKVHIDNEYFFGARAGHLHFKQPFLGSKTTTIMGRYFNSDLYTYYDNLDALDFIDRLKLIENILYALETQVHGRKIVHADIKPENIMIDESLSCKIIDYNLSIEANTPLAFIGTPVYMAPEFFKVYFELASIRASYAQDMFAMGIVIATLLEADQEPNVSLGQKLYRYQPLAVEDLCEDITDYKTRDYPRSLYRNLLSIVHEYEIKNGIVLGQNIKSYPKALQNDLFAAVNESSLPKIRQLGEYIDDFPAALKDPLLKIVNQLLAKNPADRPTAMRALEMFETVRIHAAALRHKMSNEEQIALKHVHHLAVSLRENLINLSRAHSCLTVPQQAWEDFLAALSRTLDEVNEISDELTPVTQYLRVKALRDCNSETEILARCKEIWQQLHQTTQALDALRDRVEALAPNEEVKSIMLNKIEVMQAKDFYFSIDNMAKMHRKQLRFIQQIENILSQPAIVPTADETPLTNLSLWSSRPGTHAMTSAMPIPAKPPRM